MTSEEQPSSSGGGPDSVDFRTPVGKLLRPRTSREIRRSGLAGMLVGLPLLALGAVLSHLLTVDVGRTRLMLVPTFMVTGFFCLMGGAYRLVTGKTAEQARRGFFWSLLRITLGLILMVGTIAVFFVALALLNRPS